MTLRLSVGRRTLSLHLTRTSLYLVDQRVVAELVAPPYFNFQHAEVRVRRLWSRYRIERVACASVGDGCPF